MNLKKVMKACPLGFVEEANGMSEDELNASVLTATDAVHETEESLESDEDVAKAKEALKILLEPYREALKSQKAKIKYCKYRLTELGK